MGDCLPYTTPLHKQITPANEIASVTALLLSRRAASETEEISPPIIAKTIEDNISIQKTHFIIIMTIPFCERHKRLMKQPCLTP